MQVVHFDMYPLYWTPSKGGIFMRYSHEYKRKCIEMYYQGIWPETPDGVKTKSFHDKIRLWVRIEEANGPQALKHKNFNKDWSAEEKLALVARVLAGETYNSVAVDVGIPSGMLFQWVRKYKSLGYNGLITKKKGRPSKETSMKKKEIPEPLTESEREELIRIRAELEYLKTENEVIKKEIALREEKQAALLKARKQQSSKNSVKKDIR